MLSKRCLLYKKPDIIRMRTREKELMSAYIKNVGSRQFSQYNLYVVLLSGFTPMIRTF